MIHDSSIDKYKAAGRQLKYTLEKFIATQKQSVYEYGLNKGFIVVSEQATLFAPIRKMEEISSCQDIFITKDGSPDEPLTGWISNL